MIPLHLRLSGFLSYLDQVEVDFTAVDLACISGSNGAGKSSLLDAITWALFGQARKRDESIINLHPEVKAAEVCFTFSYEGNIYRVQRTAPRGKTNLLEFHILQDDGRQAEDDGRPTIDDGNGQSSVVGRSPDTSTDGKRDSEPANVRLSSGPWKPLTERTLRETQMRIEGTLRLDYETFVNASFFLQGKADQFTQQRSGDRKRILGSILGLEVWETYRQQAIERRKGVESEISAIDGRLHEISAELREEDTRKARLKELEGELEQISQARLVQEATLENIRKTAATLAEQGRLVESLARQTEAATRRLIEMELRVEARRKEKETYSQIIARAEAIEAAYAAWQQARADIEYWDIIAQRLREQEKRRQGPLDEINAARARLQQEQQTLASQQSAVRNQQSVVPDLLAQLESTQKSITEAELQLAQRSALESELQEARQSQAEARAENPRLKAEMDHLKERIDGLSHAEGAACPLCGQPLQPEERSRLIEELSGQGKELGDRFRTNLAVMRDSEKAVRDLELQVASLGIAETNLRNYNRTIDQINSRLEGIEQSGAGWESSGAPRLKEITQDLEAETFAQEARERLAGIDAELKAIGYDAAAHDAARKAEAAGRTADAELRALEKSRAVMAPLEREISELTSQISLQKTEVDRQNRDYEEAAARLAAAQAEAPDLNAAERSLYLMQEQENRLRMELGAARQKVEILKDLKARRKALDAQREALAHKAGQYKQLERAFGKDGVPALLIEQALPQIEAKANEVLERLSGGSMSVRFLTQAAYKDKKRDDLKETLDILISDGAGIRDYEMYSIDGSEPVYIRKNGRIFCRTIQDLWQEKVETRIDGDYELQNADFEALCYNDGRATWLPAESILRHPAPKEMLRITFAPGGYSVKITPNHSIFVITPQGLKIKRGDEVKPGDYVLTPRRIPDNQIQEQVDLLDWISPEFVEKGESVKKRLHWDEQNIWSRVDQPIRRYVGNKEALAEFLGLAVAEGSGEKAYTISVGGDAETARKVVELANEIFGTSRRSITKIPADKMAKYVATRPGISARLPKEQYHPFVGGRLVANILSNMIGCGSNQKHIPDSILNAPQEGKIAFLQGLIKGDGHTRIRMKKSQVEIGITTVSPKLVADTIFLCRQIGIWATVEKHGDAGFRRGMNHQHSYRINLSGGANTGAFVDSQFLVYSTRSAFEGIPLDLVGITRHTKQKRIKRTSGEELFPCGARVVPKRSQEAYQKMAHMLENWAVLEVASIEKTSPSTPYVYDLVVPENHTFVAGTGLILVHNSGGEAFRVNFAIRLALSEVLAQRAGARLQTLVIDEGFGSQDAQGRQKLIEAINLVRPDFAKILVITHIDELKDAFPNRIEVEKTHRGSVLRVV